MFNCGLCTKPSKHGERATHVVLETRTVIYPARLHRLHKDTVNDPGGQGKETVKEVLAHATCAKTRMENLV